MSHGKQVNLSATGATLIHDYTDAMLKFAAATMAPGIERTYVEMQKAQYELARYIGMIERENRTVTNHTMRF